MPTMYFLSITLVFLRYYPSISFSIDKLSDKPLNPKFWYWYSLSNSPFSPVMSSIRCTSILQGNSAYYLDNIFTMDTHSGCLCAFIYVALWKVNVYRKSCMWHSPRVMLFLETYAKVTDSHPVALIFISTALSSIRYSSTTVCLPHSPNSSSSLPFHSLSQFKPSPISFQCSIDCPSVLVESVSWFWSDPFYFELYNLSPILALCSSQLTDLFSFPFLPTNSSLSTQ